MITSLGLANVYQPGAEGQEIPPPSAPAETKHPSKLSHTIEKVKVFSYILLAYTSAKAHAVIVSRALNASTGPDAFAALEKLNGKPDERAQFFADTMAASPKDGASVSACRCLLLRSTSSCSPSKESYSPSSLWACISRTSLRSKC
jgi:hypothetical protein